MYAGHDKKQKIIEWLRETFPDLGSRTDEELLLASIPPDVSVYRRLSEVLRIVVHHSATEKGSVEAFRILHRVLFQWDDVGYHYVIGNGTFSRDGQIEEGRPSWAVGAHARGSNEDSIGICLVGDFSYREPTDAQFESLCLLATKLMEKYGLSPSDVILHNQVKTCDTVCPGDSFPVMHLRQRLKRARDLP